MMKIIEWATKNFLSAALTVLLAAACILSFVFLNLNKHTAQTRTQELASSFSKMKADYEALGKKYENLQTDRDNVLRQTKVLLAEKSKYTELEEAHEELEKAAKTTLLQRERLQKSIEQLKKRFGSFKDHYQNLEEAQRELQSNHAILEHENKNLKDALRKSVESSPQYQSLSKEAKLLKNENNKLKKLTDRIQKVEAREAKPKKQLTIYKTTERDFKARNAQLLKDNKNLNLVVESSPKRFSDMAKENRDLIKETADTHYNLGVFYTGNKNYSMAVKEYQRALQINPNDPKIYYNLGYLYAELERHEDAMIQFKHFVEMNPNGREAEAIRSYLLIRETYRGKISKA